MKLEELDYKFIRQAKFIANEFSKDPSTKVAAIAISPSRKVLSTGYNGLPRKIEDTPERLNNREIKYRYVVHAEMNAIYNSAYEGTALNGSTLYVYGLPVCHECAKGIIQAGITRVVAMKKKNISDKWTESSEITKDMFTEAGIEYIILEEDD